MIWLLLWRGLIKFARLVVPVPADNFAAALRPAIKPVDVNEICPACGHRCGTLKCVNDTVQLKPAVQHTCAICGARWNSPTVMIVEQRGVVVPGI
jgi:hypothetical protein